MTDPITAQADLAEDARSIGKHRTLGPIYAAGTEAELAAALAELGPDDLTVLRIHFGIGRDKGTNSDVKAAVPSVTDVRSAYQAAGNRLLELLKARVQQRLDSEPDELENFEFTIRAMLHSAGILAIPAEETFTSAQCEHLFTKQTWTRRETASFNESMRARGDKRTLEDLVHPHMLRISYVRNRVHIPG